jgi:hypothetical protein
VDESADGCLSGESSKAEVEPVELGLIARRYGVAEALFRGDAEVVEGTRRGLIDD